MYRAIQITLLEKKKNQVWIGFKVRTSENPDIIGYMDFKEFAAVRLFWIERMVFLIMSLSWSILNFMSDSVRLSHKTFLVQYWFERLAFLWKCTNLLYLLLYAEQFGTSLINLVTMAQQGKIVELVNILEAAAYRNPGFLLERLIFLWGKYSEFYFVILFPLLNIYYAWWGYSREFKRENDDRSEENSVDMCTRIERVAFWVERLGFLIISFTWYFWNNIHKIVEPYVLYKYVKSVQIQFWILTNLVYILVFFDRQKKSAKSRHIGFWLERSALLGYWYGVIRFLNSDHPSDANYRWAPIINLHLSLIFPLLNVYFGWRGYSKEFRSNTAATSVVEESVNIQGKKEAIQDDFWCDGETFKDVVSKMLRTQEELLNAIEENHQKYLAESENRWQMVLKCIMDSKNSSPADSGLMDDVKREILEEIEEHFQKGLRDQGEKIHMKILSLAEENHQKHLAWKSQQLGLKLQLYRHLLRDSDASVSDISN